MDKDLFQIWLDKKEESLWVKRALTDKSFNAYRCKGVRKSHPKYEELHEPLPTNCDLATYGDAVIKLCYSELLLDNVSELTIEKSKYESDEYLVKYVARHYELLKFIDKDKEDVKMPDNYDCVMSSKYIATAVEAMIGAIYKEINDLEPIIELLKTWMQF